MMSETTDSETVEQPPCETIQTFLNAARDDYVDTEETRFREDGTAKIVLTHTHQGAFKSVSTLARRFGFIPEGNREPGGQRYRHLPGTTPTLNVEYHADRYNVVMVGNPDYTGELPYDPHPLASAVTREDAVAEVEKRRNSDDYRDDVEYRIQSCESQELIAREDERETATDGGEPEDADSENTDIIQPEVLDEGSARTVQRLREQGMVPEGYVHPGETESGELKAVDIPEDGNPERVNAANIPDHVSVLREKIAATISMALGESVETTLVESALIAGLKYEKVAEIAREMGLDVDAMNASGLGIADSEDDIPRTEPDHTVERFCGDCDGMTRMDVRKRDRGGVSIDHMECQNCGGEGAIFHMTPTSVHTGILLESEDRDERLRDLRERGVHPKVSERDSGE